MRAHRIILFLLLTIILLSACSAEKKAAKHMKKGEEYLNSSQYKEASIEFKNVVQIDPKNAKGHYNLSLAYLRLGGPTYLKLAFEELNKAVEFDPNLTDAQLKIGEFYLLSRDFDKAKEKAEFILKKEANNIDAKILLSTIYAGKRISKRLSQ